MAFSPIYGIKDRHGRSTLLPYKQGIDDGSTLTLDFTTGVLDPRLSFQRLSDATFVNSSGFVQYADTNLVRNSIFSGGNTPDQWSLPAGHAGLTTPADGVRRAVTTTAAQNFINSASMTASVGRVYAVTVNIREVSGQHYRNTIEVTNSPTYVKYYRNGTEVSSGSGEFITAQSGLITLVWVATSATGHLLRIGVGCTGANVANAVCEFERPHVTAVFYPSTTAGVAPSTFTAPAYVPNASLTGPYFAPRFDHDPTTLAPRGLLVEGQTSTLNAWGEDYTNAYWTKVGSSISATSVDGPDNVSTATRRIVESATTAQHGIRRGIATTAGQTYTVSVFVKPGSYDSFGFELYWSASYNAKAEVTSISGNTETVTSASGVNATITRTVMSASGWYRYAMTFTHPLAVGAATPDFNVLVKQTAAYAGNGTNYMDVYGFMLEAGSGASSYIPTGASTGNRARDECSITGGSFSSWFTNPNEGSFFVQYSMNYPGASMGVGVDRYAFEISDSGGSSRALCIAAYRNAPAGRNVRVFNPSGTSFDSGDTLTTSAALNTKFAFGYATADNYIAAVGVAQAFQTYNTGSIPTSPAINQMWIGANRNLSVSTYLFGCIRTIKYWPTRLPNATLQGLVS